MRNRVSLAMIVKATDEEAQALDRCLTSVRKYVDEACITVTGENQACFDVCRKHDAKISAFEWVDDFSQARNFNFKQCTGDWILWLDADDTLRGASNIKTLINRAEELKASGFAFLYEYGKDERGNVNDVHWKMQLLKNDGHFEWQGAIHEDPIQLRSVKWVRTTDIIREHHTNGERTKESYERNLRILEKEASENPKEPRTLFYLGRTYVATGEFTKAIEVLQSYLELSGWDDERYEARNLIGQCFMSLQDYDSALLAYNDAILEKESYPDAYINKGMCYLKQGEYKKALYTLQLSLQLPQPDMATYFNPLFYTRDVYSAAAICYLNVGKLNEAVASVKKALSYDSKSKYLHELREMIAGVKQKNDLSQRYFDIAQYLRETDQESFIESLLSSVPAEVSDDPRLLSLQFTYKKPKTWADNEIAIYCWQTVEPWTPENLDTGGIGGSETAVVQLAKRLQKKGWEVTVYNSCNAPAEGLTFDGVTYKNFWQFNPQDEFNVFWSWRNVSVFDYDIKAKFALLDLHDVPNPIDFTEERLEKIDSIFVKSNYHRSLLPVIADDKFTIIGNGIDISRFKGKFERDPNRFMYSSTPDRGLDLLLEHIWPKIKAERPEAELHIYYGWKTFHELNKHNPERVAWMNKVKGLMEQDGIVNHGRVGQQELAEHMQQTSMWLYPTYFPEIHCITACEMQAAGCVPVTSGYAALAETQKTGLKLEGDVYEPQWQDNYVKEVLNLSEEELSTYRAEGKTAAQEFSWDNVADAWHTKLKQ